MQAQRVAVVDARTPDAPPSAVTLDDASACALGELRALILSLPLPSSRAAIAGGGGDAMTICHDGRVLEGEERTLHSLGLLSAQADALRGKLLALRQQVGLLDRLLTQGALVPARLTLLLLCHA